MKKMIITLLSGLVSLLPIIVVVFLLSKAFVCMKWLSQPLEALLPEDTLPAHSVFLPGSPQPWSGSVMVINADRVLPVNMTYAKALYMFQQMGKGSTAYLPDVNEEIKRDGLVQGHPV